MAVAYPKPTDPRFVDLTGKLFSKWRVVSLAGKNRTGYTWNCACECGAQKIVQGLSLTRGVSRQCRRCGTAKKHGGNGTPEYMAYRNMLERCRNPHTPMFKHYGGRGIRVCDRWLESFANFLADMGKRPSESHSIDRINNDGNYEPVNCRWTTQDVQCRNNRRTRFLTFQGRTMPAIEWAAELNISYKTLCERLRTGWSDERALATPIGNYSMANRKSTSPSP